MLYVLRNGLCVFLQGVDNFTQGKWDMYTSNTNSNRTSISILNLAPDTVYAFQVNVPTHSLIKKLIHGSSGRRCRPDRRAGSIERINSLLPD